MTRCTRQAFLCGIDKFSNRSYEHRRQEIQDDMLRLASVFSIEIVAFCVMSNHYHLVLHVCRDECLADSPESIIRRAHQLGAGNDVTHKFVKKEKIEPWERDQLDTFVDTWRKRLYDISWFMKFLNEGIARRANKEDKCTGHFWEARYKSQALLDEQAVLSAMAYVDLNPIRAAMATTPEQSDHTSIQLRIDYWKDKANGKQDSEPDENFQPDSLMPFVGNPRQPMPTGLGFSLFDYLELVDWTGRAIRDNKKKNRDRHRNRENVNYVATGMIMYGFQTLRLRSMHGLVMCNTQKRTPCVSRCLLPQYSNGLIPERNRVLRGGSWNNKPSRLRSANRNNIRSDNPNNIGFRLAQASP